MKKKSWFWKSIEFVVALSLALALATLVRQTLFELYEIPSGSMRPTYREGDRLVVSKTSFGWNIPLETSHVFFDPSLVERGQIVVFTGDKLPTEDTDTTYFWLFPAKKRYIKRLMGKPGDSVYFYGGLLYAVDKDGNDIKELREPPYSTTIDHVPFNQFFGKLSRTVVSSNQYEIYSRLFNLPIAKLSVGPLYQKKAYVFNGEGGWFQDRPEASKTSHEKIETFGDFAGISNFAMVRLLTKAQAKKNDSDAQFYLELQHTPKLNTSTASEQILSYETSLIPLSQDDVEKLFKNLYTARFHVNQGRAYRDNAEHSSYPLPGIPDGTYEFYHGKAWSVRFGGVQFALPDNHPLYKKEPKILQTLFNLGLEWNQVFDPANKESYFPSRYAYFRDGALYVMGQPLFSPDDKTLKNFIEEEEKKAKATSSYIAFTDHGAPMKDGKIDIEMVRNFGFTIPEKQYLVLGDNYAMSSDSRMFGPIPEDNLQGSPTFIFWPPQERFGVVSHPNTPWITWPTILAWSSLAVLWISYSVIRRVYLHKSAKAEKQDASK